MDRGHRVVGEPQEAQLGQVVEGRARNLGDERFLQAQFDRVCRDIDGDGVDSWAAALDRPAVMTIGCDFSQCSSPLTCYEPTNCPVDLVHASFPVASLWYHFYSSTSSSKTCFRESEDIVHLEMKESSHVNRHNISTATFWNPTVQ